MDVLPYLHIPFADKGRDFTGCDCWGLVALIYKREYNIILPDYLDCYAAADDKEAISDKISDEKNNQWISVEAGKETSGDVVLLRMYNLPMHVGVVLKPRKLMLHTLKGINVSVERYNDVRWQNKILGFYRHENRNIHAISRAITV